jgi:signal transduction histidine kinase/HAMP domain-containing protein/AmiR/NasT family two-component response regulator
MISPSNSTAQRIGGLSLARTLRAALLGLTVVLAVIGAIGVAALYQSRQDYEDDLQETAAVEVGAANLLTTAVALQANLARARSRAAAGFVRRSAGDFDDVADQVTRLAKGDAASESLMARVVPAQRLARKLAVHPTPAATRKATGTELTKVRRAVTALAARQRVRRDDARDHATSRSRAALIAIGGGAGLALVAVLAFLTVLIRTMRRPLDELVDATRRMAAGDLSVRVKPSGPQELSALGDSFNVMGQDLAQAGERIEAQRKRLATTIASLGDGLVICDAQDRVTALNPRASALVPGLRIGASAHGPQMPLPQLADALAREVMIEHSSTTIAITAARLAGPEAGVVWTLRDITERARLERAKSDFVATASHELRSPLTSIKGFIELLGATNTENLTERQLEFIRIALGSTDRLVDLVNDLLDVARIEAGQFEIDLRSTDLRTTVEEVAELMEPRLLDKRQKLIVDIREPRPPALADPARVRQIVTNLVTNAHQYTPEGGRITVRLEGDAGSTRIAVSDTGRGMTPEDVERVFERFFRGAVDEGRVPGTGLGLSIVKSLIDMHRGTIGVQSRPDAGTTFTVVLPAAPAGTAAPPPTLGDRRVLVVDDEPAITELVAQQLEPLGVQPVRVHSGAEALERLRAERFDAMTLDVLMPGMSGIDVLNAVRADPKLHDLPVVFVSVSSTLAQLSGQWSVPKPIDRQRLTDVLDSAIHAKRTRVLVVAPEALRAELTPWLEQIGIEYRWENDAGGAALAGRQELFEVALVHAGIANVPGILDQLQLRGRRDAHAVVLFSTGGDGGATTGGVGAPVLPIRQAVEVLRRALDDARLAGRR